MAVPTLGKPLTCFEVHVRGSENYSGKTLIIGNWPTLQTKNELEST